MSPTPANALVVRLLGPVLIGDERPGSPKQTGVLAALAVQPRSGVSIDTLARRVWGAELPPSPRQTLYSYLAKLRGRLSAFDITIDRDGGGYVLDVDPARVDLHLMRDKAKRAGEDFARGDAAAASGLLRSALELWRGEPLTGVAGDWADGQRRILAREWLALREKWFEIELARGRHAEVLSELSLAVERRPRDETLAGLYMLALYRDGQANAALECFRDIRERLLDDLGSEPGRALSDLHTRILREAPVAVGPVAVNRRHPLPRQLPAAISTFTARSGVLTELGGYLSEIELSPSSPPVLAIVGTGGIGKTTVVTHWAHSVAKHFPDGQLFLDMCGYSLTQPLTSAQALDKLLRALGVGHDRMPGEVDEKTALYRSILADKKTLIVLDNVGTAEQARPLLPAAASCLAVITSRSSLPGLLVDNDVRSLTLDTLTPRESVELLISIIGRRRVGDDEQDVEELARLCGGFPLALRLAAAQIVSGGSVSGFLRRLRRDDRLSALAVSGDPTTALMSTFDVSYRALDPDARRVFHMVGAHPADTADARALAAMAGLDVSATRSALDRLAEVHLVTAVPKDHWGTHDLVREHAGERARQSMPARQLRDAVERALDWYAAATRAATTTAFATVQRTTGNLPQPAAPIPEFTDFESAIAWLDNRQSTLIAAISGAERAGLPEHASSLPSMLTRYFESRRQYQDWLDTCQIGLRAALSLDNPMRISGMHLKLGNVRRRTNRPDLALEHYQQALTAALRTDDPYLEAIPRSSLALLYKDEGRFTEAIEQMELALPVLRDANDVASLAFTYADLGLLAMLLGDHARARSRLREGIALAYEHKLRYCLALATDNTAKIDYRDGDHDTAARRFTEAIDLYEALNDPENLEAVRSCLAVVDSKRGRHADALAGQQRALRILEREQLQSEVAASVLNNAGMSYAAADQPGRALELHREALERTAGARYESARAHHGISVALRALGESGGEEHLAVALSIYTRLGTAEAREPGPRLY